MAEKTMHDKVAVVTGASRGIGRAIAERLGRDGAKVVVTYAGNRDKAEEVVRVIGESGSQAVAIQTDVRDLAQVRELFARTIEQFGQLDILVNNAAGTNVFKPTAELSEDEYDSMFLITRGVYFAL
jgi:3-oxoacyl-[acyl-carrier protein] reductase